METCFHMDCDTKSRSTSTPLGSKSGQWKGMPVALGCLLCCLLSFSGCVQSLMLFGKVFMGDPKQTSAFEQATGVSFEDDEKRVLLVCSSSNSVSMEFGELPVYLEDELIRRMKRRGVITADPNQAINIIEDQGGVFDANAIAKGVDEADYIMHVQIDHFSYQEQGSPNLYRGRSGGLVTGYEIVGGDEDRSEPRHALKVFQQEFRTEYPHSHPVPADDNIPKNVFIRRAMDQLADSLGAIFYDVYSSELIAD